ncbi:rhomboid family intramembrane serine protease [Myroides marinus]|uniref:Rhomboid family protein n=1 Tax=Myroides marinus TaxID=703342 RepID=A0A1H6SL78_9FLAO|nr:rhomboid family intramembrane serine protease [Myroides marinus]MDM1346174.1 rhomboid family intramembrane serine protease [Myroides marinus]MDM1351161.1 rhomboid family intramembrane serine protease [Myroides marinus]MDM1353428.1 rhomboid family intramembrane serine protease [Myroides marinus]MDM1358323.1 rhomboid family intramembrane serine protease [Myroides marinus]MDM1362732.1 rhomboid family intramembrane serine protease [Myroides marinus]
MRKDELKLKKEDFYPPLGLVAVMWFIFGLQYLGLFEHCYGVIPWRIEGIKGIFLSPLFHGSLDHIMSNTLPLFVLSVILFLFYKRQAYTVLIFGWILSGVILWLFPDIGYFQTSLNSCHIGASGLIYMLAFFLFFSGIFLRQVVLILVSIIIAILYGSLVYGVFPHLVADGVSWQGHLIGAVVGLLFAYQLNRKKRIVRRSRR